jgi:voltage-gated potassium channel
MSPKAYTPSVPHSNAYYLFVGVLTIISLVIVVLLLLPLDEAALELLGFYDILICLIFLIDFFNNLFKAPSKKAYFIDDRGWLDLLGSVPSFSFFKFSGLLRLARLSRLLRIVRRMRASGWRGLLRDMLRKRAQYTGVITVLLTILILSTASILVVQFEAGSPEANITNGLDALWWSAVTITTVGYGDHYPVTLGGRLTALFVMLMGIGIIGVLASILSSFLAGLTMLGRLVAQQWLPLDTLMAIVGVVIVLTGLIHLFGGFRQSEDLERKWSWSSFLLGVFEIVLGSLMVLASPGSTGTAVFWAASIWAFIGGALLIGDALRLRRNRRHQSEATTIKPALDGE